MRKVTERLLQAYVFTIPFESVTQVAGLGSLSRLLGIAAMGAAVLTIAAEGRFRKPDAILGFAFAFVAVSALSLLWTVSFPLSFQALVTYAQLLLSVWVVREVARTTEQQRRLVTAFFLGLYVTLVVFFTNFAQVGTRDVQLSHGLVGQGIMPALMLGIPIAFHLGTTSSGVLRAIAFLYIPLTLVAQPLTGGRAAFVAGTVALGLMVLNSSYSRRFVLVMVACFVILPLTVVPLIPQSSWDRLSGIPDEIAHGEMNYRRSLWRAGLSAFPEHPILGTGVGTFGAAIAPLQQTIFDDRIPAHNVFVGILVEQGILGIVVFVGLLAACGVAILRLPRWHRKLWAVVMLTWLVEAQASSPERTKLTWLLFALLAAQHAVGSTSGRASPAPNGSDTMASRGRPSWVPSTRVAAYSQTADR